MLDQALVERDRLMRVTALVRWGSHLWCVGLYRYPSLRRPWFALLADVWFLNHDNVVILVYLVYEAQVGDERFVDIELVELQLHRGRVIVGCINHRSMGGEGAGGSTFILFLFSASRIWSSSAPVSPSDGAMLGDCWLLARYWFIDGWWYLFGPMGVVLEFVLLPLFCFMLPPSHLSRVICGETRKLPKDDVDMLEKRSHM